MREKILSLIIVFALVGLIWYIGAKIRRQGESHVATPSGDGATAAAVQDAEPEASSPDDATTTAAIEDAATSDDAEMSTACKIMEVASQAKVDQAKLAGYCIDVSPEMRKCKTSANGATWGVRVDDVVDLEPDAAACPTGWLMRVVHVAADGTEQALIPPGPGGTRHGHQYNVYKGAPVEAIAFYDWDGDGEDEVVISRWNTTFVYTFKKGHIVPYAPANGWVIDDVKDVDGDGRPDLSIQPFGDYPTTIKLLAHSLPDGTFTLHDALAVNQAETECPSDPQITVGGGVQEDALANGIACALIWGHDPAALRKELCGTEGFVCPAWVGRMLATKPPLSLR